MDHMKGLKESYSWNEERVKLFIDIAIDHSRKKYRMNSSFTKDGWVSILKEYNKKEKPINMQQLKNRWNHLKSMWSAWAYLKNRTSGWGWSIDLGTVDPPSDEHWNEYVKRYSYGKHFRNTPLRYEEELKELFCGAVADGGGAICTTDDNPPASPKRGSASNSTLNLDANDNSNDDDDDIYPAEISEMKKKQKRKVRDFESSSKRSRSGHRNCDVGETLKEILDLEKRKADLVMGANIDPTFAEAYKILDTLEGIQIGSNQHVIALEVLEDQNKRVAFISMNESARMPWLLRAIEKKVREEARSFI